MSTTSKDPFYLSFQSISILFSWYVIVFLIKLCYFACLMLDWWFEYVKYHVLNVDLRLLALFFHLIVLVARFLHFKSTQKTHRLVEGASPLCIEAAPLHLSVREATPLWFGPAFCIYLIYFWFIFCIWFCFKHGFDVLTWFNLEFSCHD